LAHAALAQAEPARDSDRAQSQLEHGAAAHLGARQADTPAPAAVAKVVLEDPEFEVEVVGHERPRQASGAPVWQDLAEALDEVALVARISEDRASLDAPGPHVMDHPRSILAALSRHGILGDRRPL
jgi:hypothetical protein